MPPSFCHKGPLFTEAALQSHMIENVTNEKIPLNHRIFKKAANLYCPKPISRFQNTDLLLEDALREFEQADRKRLPKRDYEPMDEDENPEDSIKRELNHFSGLTIKNLLDVVIKRSERQR